MRRQKLHKLRGSFGIETLGYFHSSLNLYLITLLKSGKHTENSSAITSEAYFPVSI